MRLERSDSAQSTWQLDLASHLPLEPTIPDQRRIRHLSAVLVHNLSLDPRRDHLSAALFGGHSHSLPAPLVDPLPTSGPSSARHPAATAPTWLPSTSTSQDQGSNPLVRGADSATGSRVLPHPSALNDPPTRDEPSPLPARARPRRSSSTGTLLARPSPAAPRIDEEPAPSPLPAPPDPAGPSSSRARSASRASVASAGSSSTVRQAPRVPPPAPHRPSERERDRPASAAQFAQRERQRREEALRRRLVDCFVSLELVPVPVTVPVGRDGGPAPPARDGQEEVPGGRRRSGSVASALMQRSGRAGSSHGGGPGAGGLSAPRRGMRRRMTASSLLSTSASASLPAPASAAAAAQTPPFFVSPPSRASTHATFPIDPAHFLLPREADTDTDTDEAVQGGPALPGDPATASWPGLRESRVRARVFGRPSGALGKRKGKGRARVDVDEDEDEGDGGWRLLAEWDVELGGLTSLGRDERERAEYQDRVDDLEAVREAVELELADEVAALEARREALRARRERLEQAKELDVANRARTEVQRAELDERDAALAQVGDTSRTRRTQLITLLSHIFPIEPVPSPPAASPPLLFSIVGLPLPNSSYPPSYTDDTLSSALGYAAHVTHLVAAYLGVPLCYPLRCRASRSVVVDDISMMKGPRAFPLYARGVDRYRFDYGVFLLNKNIEQLMYSQGLTVLDLRNTLPNLKTLILSLSYDPSHADYLSATLRPSAVFSGSGEAATEGEDAPAGDEAPPASTTTTTTTTTTGKGGRSRSSSQASTIRPASRAGSSSRTSSRSSSRRGSSGVVGGAEEEEEEAAARPGSPVAPSPEPAAGLAPNAPPRPNGHANGGPTPASSRHEPTRAEKRTVPAAPTEPGAVSSLGAAAGTGLKVRVGKSAGGAATTGGAGGAGYAARIRDGLWSAVAGNVAAAAGGGGAGVRGREGAGAGGAEGR
ncbi:UV radiation resistance protein and autophagy-related subunit 14-domain-containing protein [Rhodotorula diobovata]|uniref:Autophagy-related protein 14 n=1 Tax=Rhodotorula diobovata TaxID=5288 RepID=A0A5C5FN11_9BASI|nr:UV radiation resistance protein and autophagy-related subunit 14-domain-containing protein [Rhodotorula diobovata]